MIDITLAPVVDFAALGETWRALEAQADVSFFQSWTWTGCLAEERFSDPVLLAARDRGEIVALALFNRRRGWLRDTLWLGEAGEPALDSPYIEFNGVVAAQSGTAVLAQLLRAARRAAIGGGRRPLVARRLILSAVGEPTLAAAGMAGLVTITHSAAAPWVDLTKLRGEGDFLAGLSANARYQLRRSDRRYAAAGPLTVRRAATVTEAQAWLEELAVLHQATWTARGRPGAFAQAFFRRFHQALIERGLPRGEIDLLRITAGRQLVGLLYNFRYRGRSLAYQSGFDYAAAGRQQKPGLTCHHQAIRLAAAAGLERYEFLAGGDRYKLSLADKVEPLHWLEVGAAPRPGRLPRRGASSLWRRSKN